MRSPYIVLGISQSAKENDIKNAYRKLAKIWHPDQNHSDPGAANVFTQINDAYQLLIDPPRRKLFDTGKIDANGRHRKKRTVINMGGNPFKKPPEHNKSGVRCENFKKPETFKKNINNVNKNEKFGAFLNGIFDRNTKQTTTEKWTTQKNRDQRADQSSNCRDDTISVLDDAFSKFEKNRTMSSSSLRAPDRHYDIDVTLADIFTGVTLPLQTDKQNSLDVHIPAGTQAGHQIILEKMSPCRKGENPGDIIVTVRYKSNEKFWVRNGELHTHLTVELADAVLGGDVKAQTPEGSVIFNLPEWTSSNHIIRIPKRGLPSASGERGDLCANVCILLPSKPDERLKTLLKNTRKSWFM